jgi:hypothetical protein
LASKEQLVLTVLEAAVLEKMLMNGPGVIGFTPMTLKQVVPMPLRCTIFRI